MKQKPDANIKADPFASTTGGLGFITQKTESSFKDDDDILDVIGGDNSNKILTSKNAGTPTPINLDRY